MLLMRQAGSGLTGAVRRLRSDFTNGIENLPVRFG
ncbi:cytochrome [Streptomyces sp. H34-S5]|nr:MULTISPECIES: cytochrome [unclassified Streptomyces]MCY0940909.1 cytochrome [Streptomyces sp. H34-AA3]MCY0950258.1 cytochrome [Streptomyces sp. H27-S2]MCZ4083153.1 cytochrome [Streptomyces sp. H34-S5]